MRNKSYIYKNYISNLTLDVLYQDFLNCKQIFYINMEFIFFVLTFFN